MFKKMAVATFIAASVMMAGCSPGTAAQSLSKEQVQKSGFEMVQSRASGFTVGQMMATRTVYVFFDPQCPHCGHLWESAKPLLNQVKMVWVPVGVLSEISAPQGAVLLASEEPLQTMQAHEDSILARTGGIHPGSAKAEGLQKVKANTQLFSELGVDGVPAMVFKDSTGNTKVVSGGLTTDKLKAALGL